VLDAAGHTGAGWAAAGLAWPIGAAFAGTPRTGTLGCAAAAGGVKGLGLAAQAGCSCIVTARLTLSASANAAVSRERIDDLRIGTSDPAQPAGG
jgi:hypothetical protein